MLKTFQLFSDFPADIQRLIFEHAFHSNSNPAELALISRQVNGWIEHLLYESFFTSRMADSGKSDDFYRSHVKFLTVDEVREDCFLLHFLLACHNNLIGLAFWPVTHDRKIWASLLLAMPFPSLRTLSISSRIFPSRFGCIFRAPIFQNLTHLAIKFPLLTSTLSAMMRGAHTSQPRKFLSWEGLQSLEYLNHLHIDASCALLDEDYDKIRTIVPDVLSHLPPSLAYVSINLPFRLLQKVTQHENHQRQFFVDLISGKIDPRIVICCYWSENKSFQEEFSKISKYLLPQMSNDHVFMVTPAAEFWKDVEVVMRRRNRHNRRLKAGMATPKGHSLE